MKITNLAEPMPKVVPWFKCSQWPLWMLPFRPYFLGASLLAVVSMSYWFLILSGLASWQLSIPATLWHAHEMMFGFAGAVAIGFLLTAAQTWTNVPSLSGLPLLFLTCIWIFARFSFFISIAEFPNFNLYLVIGLQLLWWLGAIIALSNMLLKAKSQNNYVFIFICALLCVLNTLFLLLLVSQSFAIASSMVDTAVLVMTLLVGVVAGRVVPFFTARGLLLTEQVRTEKVDKLLFISSLLAILLFFVSQVLFPSLSNGWAFAWLACLHLYRSVMWWHKGILKVPLLWALHLAYWALSVGLMLIALSFFSPVVLFKDALHLITVGTIGLMIIAMMVRVSHGHTGRTLEVPAFISVAFVLIALAAIVRSLFTPFLGHHLAWQLSALFWIVGFSLFLFHCAPILVNRRVDGRRG